jgi:hypothetical protein
VGNKTITLIVLFFSLILFSGCQSSIDNIKDYYTYINNEENGLILHKNIGDISFTVKHLPTDFFVYRTNKEASQVIQDSLRKEYEASWNFILKIAPSSDAKVKFDVMTETVNSLAEFKEHAFTMNFELQKMIYLNIGAKKIRPVLVETENTYGLNQHRLVNIVFAKETFDIDWEEQNEIDFVFYDEIYGTGMHHFVFSKNDFDKIPSLDI